MRGDIYVKSLNTFATTKHISIPHTVGIRKAAKVHFKLFVSFFIVKIVVAHGKCIRENSIVHIAVIYVHPLLTNNVFKLSKLSNSKMLPVHK